MFSFCICFSYLFFLFSVFLFVTFSIQANWSLYLNSFSGQFALCTLKKFLSNFILRHIHQNLLSWLNFHKVSFLKFLNSNLRNSHNNRGSAGETQRVRNFLITLLPPVRGLVVIDERQAKKKLLIFNLNHKHKLSQLYLDHQYW